MFESVFGNNTVAIDPAATPTDFFQYHNIFYTWTLCISPFWTLLLFSEISLPFYGWLITFLFSNEAVIFLAFYRGYFTSNPWAVAIFVGLYLSRKISTQVRYLFLLQTLRTVYYPQLSYFKFWMICLYNIALRSCFYPSVVLEAFYDFTSLQKLLFGSLGLGNAGRLAAARLQLERMRAAAAYNMIQELLSGISAEDNATAATNFAAEQTRTTYMRVRQLLLRGNQAYLIGEGARYQGAQEDTYQVTLDATSTVITLFGLLTAVLQELSRVKDRLAIFQDPTRLSAMNRDYLYSLKSELNNVIVPIDEKLEYMQYEEHHEFESKLYTCCLCLDRSCNVQLSPCYHTCLCDECLGTLLEKRYEGDNQGLLDECFLCKTKVLSWRVEESGTKVYRIPLSEYHSRGCYHTSIELAKLYYYVQYHPYEREKLHDPNVFEL